MADLKYLYRGGRIGKAKALMGSVLKIIPVVGLMGNDKDGEIIPALPIHLSKQELFGVF